MKEINPMLLAGALVAVAASSALGADNALFSLQWIPNGNNFGVFAAKDEGFYRDADLDVTIQRGFGSGDTVKRVATGSFEFGIADAGSVIAGRCHGQKIKMVASLYEKPPDVIFFVKNNGITRPGDLEGRTIGVTAGEAGEKLIPLFAERAGFGFDKLRVVNIGPSAKYASLVAKSVDSIVGFVNEEPPIQAAAKKTGLEIGKFVFSDYGIDYYSLGLIASDDTVATRPDKVKRFAAATMRGYAWSIHNPDKAADDFVRNYPETSRDIALAQWNTALPLIATERTRKEGLGVIENDKMAATIKLISALQQVKCSLTPKDVYISDFIPYTHF